MLPNFYVRSRSMDFMDWLDTRLKAKGNGRHPSNDGTLFAITMWWIWKWRNDEVFNSTTKPLRIKTS